MVEHERLADSVEFRMVDDRWIGDQRALKDAGAKAREGVENKTETGPIH